MLGERIVPWVSDPLPWDALGELDGIYFTGGDAGAVRAARAARALVATSRALEALPEAIDLGARCGAACLTGRGPYAGQLSLR